MGGQDGRSTPRLPWGPQTLLAGVTSSGSPRNVTRQLHPHRTLRKLTSLPPHRSAASMCK